MIKNIKNLFNSNKDEMTSDFSDFFYKSSSEEKKRVLNKVIRQANEDQRNLIKRASVV